MRLRLSDFFSASNPAMPPFSIRRRLGSWQLIVLILVTASCGATMMSPTVALHAFQSQPPPTAAEGQQAAPSDLPTQIDAVERQQVIQLLEAVVRLPLATALACVLALRPRRRGAPPRQASVVETQIILALVGAVVMLVVGTSLARAFGIVGAAGLVRYRARIGDPKDAGVMLSTLAIGLAAGVGLWMLAVFATAFILGVLWVIESFEKTRVSMQLTVKAKNPVSLKPKLEGLLTRYRLDFVLRTATEDELSYQVQVPIERKTDRLTNAILKLDPGNETGVEWEEKKVKS
jgi:hypothetical protein